MPHLTKTDKRAKVSANEARRRKEVALAGLRELQLKEKEKSLIDAEQAEAEYEKRTRDDAEALLNWPARIATDMAADLGVDARKFQEVLDRHIRIFMRERSMVGVGAPKPQQRKPISKKRGRNAASK